MKWAAGLTLLLCVAVTGCSKPVDLPRIPQIYGCIDRSAAEQKLKVTQRGEMWLVGKPVRLDDLARVLVANKALCDGFADVAIQADRTLPMSTLSAVLQVLSTVPECYAGLDVVDSDGLSWKLSLNLAPKRDERPSRNRICVTSYGDTCDLVTENAKRTLTKDELKETVTHMGYLGPDLLVLSLRPTQSVQELVDLMDIFYHAGAHNITAEVSE